MGQCFPCRRKTAISAPAANERTPLLATRDIESTSTSNVHETMSNLEDSHAAASTALTLSPLSPASSQMDGRGSVPSSPDWSEIDRRSAVTCNTTLLTNDYAYIEGSELRPIEHGFSVLKRFEMLAERRITPLDFLKSERTKIGDYINPIFVRPPNGSTPSGGQRWNVDFPTAYGEGIYVSPYVASLTDITERITLRRYPVLKKRRLALPCLVVFGNNLMQVQRLPLWERRSAFWDRHPDRNSTSTSDESNWVPRSPFDFLEEGQRVFAFPTFAINTILNDRNRRFYSWVLLELASSGIPEEELQELFASSRTGKTFTLQPEPRSAIPFQWVHTSAQTIPNDLADTPCSFMGVQRLLQILNNVLGTDVQLDGKGVRQCLEYFINGSIVGRALHRIDDETQHFNTMQSVRPMDFGQAYAHWRTVKNADFSHFLRTLEDRRLADEAMRRDAVHGTYISNAELPPRRLWDLLSNRIVPFHLVSEGPIPPNIWTVSHSWCHPTARRSIETSINAYQWPVPVPGVLDDDQKTQDPDTMTTLEHVRVELLNYGAEYAWLDILCIRQRGNPQGEALRAEEWRTDIPTIGYIYSHKLPCVIYFNGLGLPLKLDEVTLHSERHWLNRVWTLQEGTRQWLLGGATEATLATSQACAFFQESLSDAILQRYQGQRSDAVQAIQKRHCESDLDRVHGLAYVFGCITLPIYDLNMTPDEAWVLLLKHIDPEFRREIVGLHLKHNPQSASLLPSLEEYKEYSSYNQSFSDPERIPMLYYNLAKPVHLVDERSLGDSEPGIYFQDVIHLGELSVSQFALSNHTHKLEVCTPLLEHFRWKNTSTKYCIYGRYNPGIKYDVVSFGRDVSLVVQVVGEMEVDGQTVQRVVKCGLIEWSGSAVYYGAWLPGHIRQWVERRIVYVQDYNVQRVPYNVYR